MKVFLNVVTTTILALGATACESGRIYTGSRVSLDDQTEHQQLVAPASNKDPSAAGLWVLVHNDLPVVRHNDAVVSQAYIETLLTAKKVSAQDVEHRLREGVSRPEGVTYVLNAPVLSESSLLFHLDADALDSLVGVRGGKVSLEVKDSMQGNAQMHTCGKVTLRSSSEAAVQKVTFVVRHSTPGRFECEAFQE